MQYAQWHKQVIKHVEPMSETSRYLRVLLFGLITFGLTYAYTWSLNVPNTLNKSIADTSIILIGLSMLLSSLCYFWNFVDSKIIYRKHLGLIGFAFGVVHILLSFEALKMLFDTETWMDGSYYPAFTGLLATIIFTIMTLVSNQYSALHLGGKTWRRILRTGYLAMFFIFAHIVLLKSMRWMIWFKDGMKTLPSMSLIVAGFIVLVLTMRGLLWLSLKKKA